MPCLNLFSVNTHFLLQRRLRLQIIHCLMIKLIPRIISEMLVVVQLVNKFLPCSGSFVNALTIKSITRLGRCTSIIFLLFLTARLWFFYRWAETCGLINFNLLYENYCDWRYSPYHYICDTKGTSHLKKKTLSHHCSLLLQAKPAHILKSHSLNISFCVLPRKRSHPLPTFSQENTFPVRFQVYVYCCLFSPEQLLCVFSGIKHT
jgi:hypothetical protein